MTAGRTRVAPLSAMLTAWTLQFGDHCAPHSGRLPTVIDVSLASSQALLAANRAIANRRLFMAGQARTVLPGTRTKILEMLREEAHCRRSRSDAGLMSSGLATQGDAPDGEMLTWSRRRRRGVDRQLHDVRHELHEAAARDEPRHRRRRSHHRGRVDDSVMVWLVPRRMNGPIRAPALSSRKAASTHLRRAARKSRPGSTSSSE